MNVLITLTTAGADTGPFNLYSNVDNYTTAFETNISKGILVAGYTSTIVPPGTTAVRVWSMGIWPNCPVAESLPAEVENKCKLVAGIKSAELKLTFEPTWEKEMMSEVAQLELGFM